MEKMENWRYCNLPPLVSPRSHTLGNLAKARGYRATTEAGLWRAIVNPDVGQGWLSHIRATCATIEDQSKGRLAVFTSAIFYPPFQVTKHRIYVG